MTVHVFCGPTISADQVRRILPAARAHPPVRHGDLLSYDYEAGDVVVIIDGVFHATAAVRHKEILLLLAGQVTVVGSSSMGALRAAELYPLGMRGVGRIFEMYRDGVIEADDEVAVAHTPDEFRLLSIALVNVRAELDKAVEAEVVTRAEADRLVTCFRHLPYTRRTWGALRNAVADDDALRETVGRLTDWRIRHPGVVDAKRDDAIEALTLVADGSILPADTSEWAASPWRTPRVEQWIMRFGTRRTDAGEMRLTAELQHQQLYDPAFPTRWRHVVLAWIAGEPLGSDSAMVERHALERARSQGLDRASLSRDQARYWLSPQEIDGLDDDGQLLRILVRSARFSVGAHTLLTARDMAAYLLNPELDSAAAVRAAWDINAAVAATGPHRAVHRLRPDLLRVHLAEQWHLPGADRGAMDAAARERGFLDADGAAEAARGFYLHASGAIRQERHLLGRG